MEFDQRALENSADAMISELFHENTKQRKSDFKFIERVVSAMNDPRLKAIMASSYKHYPSARKVLLPRKFPKARKGFDQVILSRRSTREFGKKPLTISEVGKILYFSNGLTETINEDSIKHNLRTCPSAGALYPIEMYLISLNVKNLPSGIYHFNPIENMLEWISKKTTCDELRTELKKITFTEEAGSSAAAIILTGIPLRSRSKYSERGYRFMLMEAGHMTQNILLTATSLNLNCFPIGGFIDDDLNKLLKISGLEEISLYIIPIGKKS